MSEKVRVRIGMPCYGRILPEVVASLLGLACHSRELLADFGAPSRPGLACGFFHYRNLCFVDEARCDITREVLEDPACTHLLWVDWDHFWPHNALAKLLARNVDVAAALYFMRTPPFDIPHGNFINREFRAKRLDHMPDGLEPCDMVGFGCTLMTTTVLRRMRDSYGDELWFRKDDGGEDHWFGRRLAGMGEHPFVDGDVVLEHITETRIGADHWRATHIPQETVPSGCWLDRTGERGKTNPPEGGWFDGTGLYADVVDQLPDPAVVVEVGSFVGRSAIILARLLNFRGIKYDLYCVDNWLASDREIPGADDNIRRAGGSYRPYFERNLKEAGVLESVNLIQGDSAKMADQFFHDGMVDFCFIDADHSVDGCSRDIRAWLPKIKSGGVLAGHDYDWPSVRAAVTQCLPGAMPRGRTCWVWRKPV